MTPDYALEILLLNFIKKYKKSNPVNSKTIENLYKITGAKVREIIHNLRRSGELIGSNSDGYFICANFDELEATIANLESRATDMFETARILKKRFEFNQEKMFN